MATNINYVSPDKLEYYHGKISAYIDSADKKIQDALDAEIIRAKGQESTNAAAAQSAQTAADNAQTAVDTLSGKIGTVPANQTVMGIITNIQENAYDDTELRELATKNESDISALTTRVENTETAVNTTLPNAINAETTRAEEAEGNLDSRLKTVEGDYLKKADKTGLQNQITANKDAIDVLNGDSSVTGSVDKKVADAINTFATQISDDGTINTYKEILNYLSTHQGDASEMAAAIDALETLVGSKSVATQIAEAINAQNLSQYATDEELAEAIARIVTLEGASHTHSNKALLDTYTQTEANLADAVSKKHSHSNMTVLNGITSAKVTAWDNSEQNAKTYADEQIEDLTGVVNTKASASDLNALTTRVGAEETKSTDFETRISTLEGINHVEITNARIDQMFA